jgi:hypothetical protein
MPVLIKPIIAEVSERGVGGEGRRGEVVAVLEVVNKLGVVGRSVRGKANMDPLDGEMLELFEKQFSAMIATNRHISNM